MSSSPLNSGGMEREELREEELRLKAAFHYSVGKTCEQLTRQIRVDNTNREGTSAEPSTSSITANSAPKFSKKFISALSEAAWRQLTRVYARDLESFSRHAKRQTINESDVLLITRHNADLEAKLNVKSVELAAAKHSNKRKNTGGGGGPSKKSKT